MFSKKLKYALSLVALCSSAAAFCGTDDGGIDGGGGGTLPASPISIYDVYEVVENLRTDLRLLVRAQDQLVDYFEKDDYRHKLFSGARTLVDLVEETNIEIRNDQPCFDAHQRAVDASIYSSLPNAICLSAFRIAPKLTEDRARNEIGALILHELSHLLGTTEKEAVDFQKHALYRLREATSKEIKQYVQGTLLRHLQEMSSDANALSAPLPFVDDRQLVELKGRLSSSLAEFENSLRLYPAAFDLYSNAEDDYWKLANIRIRLALIFIDSIAAPKAKVRDYWCEAYERIFQHDDVISLETYCSRVPTGCAGKNRYSTELIHRIYDKVDLKKVVDQFQSYLKAVRDGLWQLQYGVAMNRLLPTSPTDTPWPAFVGTYEVTSSVCANSAGQSYDSGLKGIVIYRNAADNGPHLRELFVNGWADRGGLYNDSYFESLGAVRVQGNAVRATIRGEQGEIWGRRWYHHTRTMTNVGDHFTMVRRDEANERSSREYKASWTECSYQLRKTD